MYEFLNLILNFPFHLKLNQRVLKNISIILLLLCVSFTYTATASGGGGEKEKKPLQDQQDPNRQQSLLPKLDGEPENGGIEEEETTDEEDLEEEFVAEGDSTQSSFRKFNFIFYFLYKFKYENDARFGNIPQELESN